MLRAPLLAALLLCALAPAAQAAVAYRAESPPPGALYHDGPSGRYLLDGTWLFRYDNGIGDKQRFQRQPTTEGWNAVQVPNAWNASDQSEASMKGTTAWYRKDFRVPSSSDSLDWVIRFESVNYRAKVWLNGQPIGHHTGAYLPWEVRLPGLKRSGVNHLVVRVNNRRFPTDFPPSAFSPLGVPTGGWWNYGGLLREVYLRKIDRIDFNSVQIRPNLPCAACAATVDYKVVLRNYSSKPQRVRLTGRYGARKVNLGTRTMGPSQFGTFTKSLRIARPQLWSPASPHLYDASLTVRVGKGKKGKKVGDYQLRSGIRSVKVTPDGRLILNGQFVNFRGVGMHEDDPTLGFAITNTIRRAYVQDVRDLGATLIRAHYPLHPYVQELADRYGVLLWSEIPVYSVKTQYLKRAAVRRLAVQELQDNIRANQNHPSVLLWSIGNELSARPGPVQGYYIARAARVAKQMDPTRPVALAVAAYPSAGCQNEYGPLDVIGINDYFGWYPGPGGLVADRARLSPYLDTLRACYPHKAIVVSEFGAEANRNGPPEEKGTFQFQEDFVKYHMAVFATKPWLSGAVYWAIKEFRVRPGWDGGNPRPDSPLHQKGLISFTNVRKPAFFDLQALYKATVQYRSLRLSRARR
jgi:beta-glucuronidase